MSTARETALLTLYEIEYNDAYSNMALKDMLAKNGGMSSADKGLVTALVYGVVKRKITLDYVIKKYSSIKLKKISKYILLILRLGIFQIMFMNKIPESAAVNECVKLAKRYGHKSSAGFVNAVLHSVIRGRKNLEYPKEIEELLSVKYSYPEELVKKWCDDFGAEFCEELLKEMNKEPKMSIRVNTLKTDRDALCSEFEKIGVSAEANELYSNALYTSGFDVGGADLYKNGYFTPQDTSAMLAGYILSPKKGSMVIDMCAAPGGKSTHMAELMQNRGKILSFDIHEHKIEIINANAERLGIDIINGVCADSTRYYEEYENSADFVLADVPCSGTGIIRRKADIKYKYECVPHEIQYSIAENAGRYLKVGGEMVYSTCSINHEENEDVINRFLAEHKNFEIVDFYEILPDKLKKETAHKGYITFYPCVDGIDGFFIAKLKKISA